MCGFVGYKGEIENKNIIKNSLNSIIHRGPDNVDFYFSMKINLGFARLSIQDLSNKSNQPIVHPSNDFIMLFNGEIYNHISLRPYIKSKINLELLDKSNSDTITLLALFNELGIEKTLNIIQGMFAITIFNFRENNLYLIRDHFGQKPLYYKSENNNFIFGSEVKSLKALSKKDFVINKKAISLPLLQTHLPEKGFTLFEEIYSVEPGQILKIDKDNILTKTKYFDPSTLISEDLYYQINKTSIKEIAKTYEHLIRKSVKGHLISDVPIGTLFSAGLDSSIIANLAGDMGNSYRIGFKTTTGEDDIYYKIYDQKSQNQTYFCVDNEEIEIKNLPNLLYMYESINKPDGLILSSLTSSARNNGLKVLLNGDGSDEIFAGYQYFESFYNDLKNIESKSFRITNKVIKKIIPSISNSKYNFSSLINHQNFIPNDYELLEPYLDIFQYPTSRIANWNYSLKQFEFIKSIRERNLMAFTLDELKNRLPRYLNRSDRYGMMNSVEMRAPFLDLELIKYALNTPIKFKLSRFKPITNLSLKRKFILQEMAKSIGVPKEIIYRKKKGTNFKYYNSMIKIIKFVSLKNVADILSVSEKRLKESIIERNDNSNYPLEVLNRYAYNILCIQIITDIFEFGINPDSISEKFSYALSKY